MTKLCRLRTRVCLLKGRIIKGLFGLLEHMAVMFLLYPISTFCHFEFLFFDFTCDSCLELLTFSHRDNTLMSTTPWPSIHLCYVFESMSMFKSK